MNSDAHICERVALPCTFLSVKPTPAKPGRMSELGGVCCEDGAEVDFPRPEAGRRQRVPCEETMVCAIFHNIFLKPGKRLSPLAIEQGHVDVKDTHQRVCYVLNPCGLASCHPTHPLGCALVF
jgi:hypothetical protein